MGFDDDLVWGVLWLIFGYMLIEVDVEVVVAVLFVVVVWV